MAEKKRFINYYLQSTNGITLVALVITIIVLIILSAVSINALWGENGVITQAQEASFRTEMAAIREKVDLYNAAVQMEAESDLDISLVQAQEADTEKWKASLKLEILLWGNYPIEVNRLVLAYAEKDENFKKAVVDGNGNTKEIYYIEDNEDTSKKYIYNKETDIIYKINQTRLASYTVHSVEELDYLQNGGTREKRIPSKNYTKISYNSEMVEVNGVKYYEPDLNNIAKESTSLVFYKLEGGTVTGDTKEISATAWLEGTEEGLNKKRGNTITTEDGATYVLYDYKNQIWANIKIVSGGLETNWVWIPRYAYNEETATATDTKIIFVNTDNNQSDGSELPTGYAVAGKFKDNKQLGIWGSKYEPSAKVQKDAGFYEYYIPDLSGFNKENVYIQIYNKETDSFEREVQASTITNLSEFSKENLWFDYENKIWANIKVVNDGLETWWVWIPRYAYNEAGTTDETDVIFVDTNNKPIDGSKLPSGYSVAGKFKDNNQKGIWGSKYEPSAVKK